MAPSGEANLVKSSGRAERAKPKEEVLAEASIYVTDHGGDPTDRILVLAHCQFQFGMYQGQRFRWLLENSLGYALYLVHSISKERAQATPLSENEQLFQQYTSHIREFTEELEKYSKKQEMQAKARETGDQGCLMVEFGDFQGRSMKEVYEDQSKEAQALIKYLVTAAARPNTNMAVFKAYVLKRRTLKRSIASSSSAPPSAASGSSAPPSAALLSAASGSSAPPSAASGSSAPPSAGIQTGAWKPATVKALLARSKNLSPSQLARKLMSPVNPSPAPRCILTPAAKPPTEHLAHQELFPTATSEDDYEELVSAASQCEAQLNTALATTLHLEACADLPPVAMPGLVNQPPAELPSHWKDQLPPFQQEWIRHTLFKANPRTGKPELVAQLKLWPASRLS
ncbi:uncharacterized protein LOC143109299 [Alosa pseudoharengus]|uniref:uncharacterized protein LOC143109299 n=1 Tax=Alosa pseudoharengus TaxID=34774 RepID=UPI003F8B0418